MFPPTALAGFAVVVDALVRFFAFDLPFELPFLATVFMVGRLAVLPFGDTVVLDWTVEVVSVLVVGLFVAVLPGVAARLKVPWNTVGLVAIGWVIVENVVSTTSGSAIFVKPDVGVASSSKSSLRPASSGVKVTKGCGVIVPVKVLRLPIGFMKLSSTSRSRWITTQSRSVLHIASATGQ